MAIPRPQDPTPTARGAPKRRRLHRGSPPLLVTTTTVSASIGISIPGASTADARATSSGYGTTAASWAPGLQSTTVTDPGGLPSLPVTTYTYDDYLNVVTASIWNGLWRSGWPVSS